MIEVKNLSKQYEISKTGITLKGSLKNIFKKEKLTVTALKDISFTIDKGECVGYVGPNGAGKSTTLKLLAGIIYPTSGEVVVNGYIPWEDRKKYVRQVGMMFGNKPQLWPELTPNQSYELLKKIYNIDTKIFTNELNYLVETLNISDILNRPLRQLSLGQRMRCELASTFLHSPKIVFLDEPTIGLDIESKHQIRKLIKKINMEKETTIIFTSHDLHEIEAICERILIIDKGCLIIDESSTEIKNKFAQQRIIKLETKRDEDLKKIESYVRNDNTITTIQSNTIEIAFDPKNFDLKKFFTYISEYNINNIIIEDSDIEKAILKIYKGAK